MKLLVAMLFVVGCAKSEEHRKPVEPLSAAEVARAHDACQSYVDKVCSCAGPAAQQQCTLAKPLPQALDLALQTAANPGEERDSQVRSQVFVRETVKECVEELAKLPAIGCR
ncbi:MAG TPA: hypothetical protein VGG28_12985 [Kofleriaceae bacterium]|jgi:hypothetical protein